MRVAFLALSLCAAPVVAAEGKPSLREVPEVENIIFAAAVANEISENCDGIAARRLKAIGMAWRLRSRANALGYSDAEIKAYVESDAEKARMRAKGERYLAQNGVSYADPQTFCTFGRAEIEKSSAIGALLKAR
ncbi:DUF5333 domain-containing protein [Sedimentitalea nanhaiensis]|uniref:DUF5333 domain-containing protein n=1 Tax=Sedimentitalea nanhaiensis TaxID=999627 RepID=UPI000684A431|nr:DUF5333 domain-containing protein [Sedimentitalea nanhaiensis]